MLVITRPRDPMAGRESACRMMRHRRRGRGLGQIGAARRDGRVSRELTVIDRMGTAKGLFRHGNAVSITFGRPLMRTETCPACNGAKVDAVGSRCIGCNGHGIVEITSEQEADVVRRDGRIFDRGTNKHGANRRSKIGTAIIGIVLGAIFIGLAWGPQPEKPFAGITRVMVGGIGLIWFVGSVGRIVSLVRGR